MNEKARTPGQELRAIAQGYIRTKALYAVAKLGVADHISSQSADVTELAKLVGAQKVALYRVMRLLSASGVFREEDGQAFSHTPMSEHLRDDHPQSERRRIIFWGEHQYEAFEEILHSIETLEPGFERRYGAPIFDYLRSDDEANQSFQGSMRNHSNAEIAAILAAYDFSDATKIVDVGGGTGALLSGVLSKYPDKTGILFDQENTIELAKSGSGGPLPRCDLVAGSFFDAVPDGGDLYMLKGVIHDWYDDDVIQILRNIRSAMDAGQKLLIIEFLVGPPNQPSEANERDITMLVVVGGMQRRKSEYQALLEVTGFDLTTVVETQADASIVVAQAK